MFVVTALNIPCSVVNLTAPYVQVSSDRFPITQTQAIITKDLPYNASTNVLWPSPNGVIYPVGKWEHDERYK